MGLLLLSAPSRSTEARAEEVPSGEKTFRLAIFPVENLSGTLAPIKEIRDAFAEGLKAGGFDVLDEETLRTFMAKYRIRYTGGTDSAISNAFKKEIQVDGVLIVTVELYSEENPPKISLISRLVTTGPEPLIAWTDTVGLAGDDAPGFLGLGLIRDPGVLMKKGITVLLDSLTGYLSGKNHRPSLSGAKKKFRPRIQYRSDLIEPDKKYTVAVLPFFNLSTRKNAGDLMVLHFIRALKAFENFNVIEFGLIRQDLLEFRIVMQEGVSLADANAIWSASSADLVVSGTVIDYEDYQGIWGKPRVQFSAQILERKSQEVVWSSESYNGGDDEVYFFDIGRVNTASAMASQMTWWVGTAFIGK